MSKKPKSEPSARPTPIKKLTPEQIERHNRDLELWKKGELVDEWEDFDLIDLDNAGPWPEDMNEGDAGDAGPVIVLE